MQLFARTASLSAVGATDLNRSVEAMFATSYSHVRLELCALSDGFTNWLCVRDYSGSVNERERIDFEAGKSRLSSVRDAVERVLRRITSV